MFGFGKSQKDDIFDIEDIRELVLTFPHKALLEDRDSSAERLEEDDLVPLASGEGFIQFKALAAAFHKLLDGKYGRLPVAALATHLDISNVVLLLLTREDQDYILSRSGDNVITKCEQQSLAGTLEDMASKEFILAEDFSRNHDISREDLVKLLRFSEQSSSNPPLQFLSAPESEKGDMEASDYPYIHTLSLLLNLRESISSKVKESVDEAKPTSWTRSDLLGLSNHAFRRLAQSIIQSSTDSETIQGFFEGGDDEVRFIPRTSLLRKANRRVKEVALGVLPFCDLDLLTQKFPTLIPNAKAAKDFVEGQCNNRDGSPYKFIFISHYAIGEISLNNTARKCMETLGAERHANTKPYLHSFPDAIQHEVQTLLIDRTALLFRSLGAHQKDIQVFGPYMIQTNFIGDLEFVAQRLATQDLEKRWKEQIDVPSSQESLASPVFLEALHKQSEIDLDLLSRLWARTDQGIYLAAKEAYDDRLGKLRTESLAQFSHLWQTRVVLKAQLYSTGLSSVTDGALREQLQDLLYTYVAGDLIPANLKRAKTKSLVRTPQMQKNLTKLLESLKANQKDKITPLDALAKFNKKMGFTELTEKDLAAAKKEYMQDIAQSMEKDTDGPRLFLGALTNIFASKHGGVLYATGKFAPRILKTLKSELDAEQVKRLEEVKEAVKAGAMDDAMREELRSLTKAAVEAYDTASTNPS